VRQRLEKEAAELIGNLPWGAHWCQSYKTKKDLLVRKPGWGCTSEKICRGARRFGQGESKPDQGSILTLACLDE
jgi:hypothetical protein